MKRKEKSKDWEVYNAMKADEAAEIRMRQELRSTDDEPPIEEYQKWIGR